MSPGPTTRRRCGSPAAARVRRRSRGARDPAVHSCACAARTVRAVGLADSRAESPLETRGRLRIAGAGLPPPELQVEIRTGDRLLAAWCGPADRPRARAAGPARWRGVGGTSARPVAPRCTAAPRVTGE
ncbi:hypothetical protein DMO24_09760 [Modestobacter versicolor]|uniref:Uncharacterized protein n=1 Tax=Modestobacter versicolor TaxID=429133 RepID=A0A323VQE3_9ACTN|nr:hypothetical protein DMO24_09760 [Modestobacter versicolor]